MSETLNRDRGVSGRSFDQKVFCFIARMRTVFNKKTLDEARMEVDEKCSTCRLGNFRSSVSNYSRSHRC